MTALTAAAPDLASYFRCLRLGETGVRGHRGDIVVYRIDPA